MRGYNQMNLTSQKNILAIKHTLINLLSVISSMIALVAIIGWYLDLKILQSFNLQYVSMNPFTAVCLIFLSISTLLYYNDEKSPSSYYLQIILVGFVALSSPMRFSLYVTGIDIGVDQILFPSLLDTNRVAPNTAFALLILSVSHLFLLFKASLSRLCEGLSLSVVLLSTLSLCGYFYGSQSLYGLMGFTPMAFNTTIALLLLSISQSLFHLKSKDSFISLMARKDLGGKAIRSLTPMIILTPLLIGLILVQIEERLVLGTSLNLSLFAILTIVILLILTWRLSRKMSLLDQKLKLEKQTLDSVIDAIEDGIIVSNSQGEITRFNPKANEMLDIHVQKYNPAIWDERIKILEEDKKTRFSNKKQPLTLALIGKSSDNIRQYIAYKNKPNRFVSLFGRPLKYHDGRILGGVVIIKEVKD